MTITRKLCALLCALSVLTLCLPTVFADEASNTVLNVDYETENLIPAFEDFKGKGLPAVYEIKTDAETSNSYAEIDYDGSLQCGGYALSDSISDGIWEISFKINMLGGEDDYAAVAMANKNDVKKHSLNQFQIVGISDGKITVNKEKLSGDLTPVIGEWYDYTMILDKNTNTYTAEISDGINKAEGNGSIPNNLSYDGLMFANTLHAYIDDIEIKTVHPQPEVTKVELLDDKGDVQEEASVATSAIRITFSDEMAEESLAEAVKITGVSSGERTIGQNGRVYTVGISDILTPNEEFSLEITRDAVSIWNKALKEGYNKTFKTGAISNVLLDIDFEENKPDFLVWSGNPAYSYQKEDNGNTYFNHKANWSGSGWLMKQSIPKTGGNYTVEFDFSVPQMYYSDGDVNFMCLNDTTSVANENIYFQLGLLQLRYGKFAVNGTAIGDNEYEADKWYSYKLDFNRSKRTYTVSITERDNPEIIAAAESGSFHAGGYGSGMFDKVYDSFKFYFDKEINIDNIKVTSLDEIPEVKEIKFLDKNGADLDFSGAKASLLTKSISIELGAEINPRTLKDNISLTKENGESVDFTYELSGSMLRLKDIDFEENTSYSLYLNGSISSVYGYNLKNMAEDYMLNFTCDKSKAEMKLSQIQIDNNSIDRFNKLRNGEATAVISFENTKRENVNANLIVSYYDEDGKRISVSVYSMTAAARDRGEINFPITISKPDGAVSVRFMLWENLSDVKPFSSSIAF